MTNPTLPIEHEGLVERLRELAGKATAGPWEVSECLDVWVSTPDTEEDEGTPVAKTGDIHWTGKQGMTEASMKANGAYIAAANPQAVIALLDEIDTLRKALEPDLIDGAAHRLERLGSAESATILRDIATRQRSALEGKGS